MAGRPKATRVYAYDQVSGGAGLADQHLKANGDGAGLPGILYSFEIQWSGMTVGSMIHIHDTATAAGDASAAKGYTFMFPTAAGSYSGRLPAVGIEFINGLWLNAQLAGAGNILSITIGFD